MNLDLCASEQKNVRNTYTVFRIESRSLRIATDKFDYPFDLVPPPRRALVVLLNAIYSRATLEVTTT